MPYTHVTGLMVLFKGDGVTAHVLNYGTTLEATRIRVFANRGGGVLVADSGDVKITPRATTALSYGLTAADECWAEIETSSETLIPMCYFVRPAASGFQIISLFRGAEFAVFDPAGKRLW